VQFDEILLPCEPYARQVPTGRGADDQPIHLINPPSVNTRPFLVKEEMKIRDLKIINSYYVREKYTPFGLEFKKKPLCSGVQKETPLDWSLKKNFALEFKKTPLWSVVQKDTSGVEFKQTPLVWSSKRHLFGL